MLGDLQVKNFAIIEHLSLSFSEGLNILTGETGAGKSIIIGALEMLFGSRARTDIIKNGKEAAYIEASYFIDLPAKLKDILKKAGVELDPEMLLLSREIRRNGRNRCRINGQLVPLKLIKEVAEFLVDIHGQHEHQNLLQNSYHIELLDELLPGETKDKLLEIEDVYYQLKEILEEKERLNQQASERARRLDIIEYQLDEIETANLKAGELEEIESKLKRLENIEDISATIYKAIDSISGDQHNQKALLDQLGTISSNLSKIVEFDDDIKELSELADQSFYSLQELNFQLQDYHDQIDYNKNELSELRERLDIINTMRRKYGETISEILSYKNNLIEEREELESIEDKLSSLEIKENKLKAEYESLDKEISKARKQQAQWLENEMIKELKDLAMKDARFEVEFQKAGITPKGRDKVKFLISTNLGGELKELSKIASGGEISRIMLAFKSIIAGYDKVRTIIFDEIETGVGGETARQVAARLYSISTDRQVISISHLPQIASLADRHFYIYKETEDQITKTKIDRLSEIEREEEIARMISGDKKTETSLKHASELIEDAESIKASI
ncbi:DNA repair protein RecN [Halanaerobiaceae bacterium Z-7014]|uniref:DNA repair protein RecN n=1 Tax=Halonatronomonas betaini TaxID=2778430 RepID=A0A931ASW7_9FIRM|nr:DNA repair protein RecN [Halonatronomonas betaini]MBF8437554.1 DNA repair protein RecN [Halonatronomonas betaini]